MHPLFIFANLVTPSLVIKKSHDPMFFLLGIQLVILLDLEIFKVFIVVSIFVHIIICSRIFFFILEIHNKWVIKYIILNLICILNALIFSCPHFITEMAHICIVFYSTFTFASLCWTFDGMAFTWLHSIEWDGILFALSNVIYVYLLVFDGYSGYLFFHTFLQ